MGKYFEEDLKSEKYLGMMEKYFVGDLKSENIDKKYSGPMENFVSHQFPSQCSGQLS